MQKLPLIQMLMRDYQHLKSVKPRLHVKKQNKRFFQRILIFSEIRQSDQFHTWAKSQPEAIQEWVYNNPDNVELAVKAIDLYKLENDIPMVTQSTSEKSQTSAKASAADMVSTKTTSVDAKQPKVWSQREIAALSMAEYDKYEKEIDAAIMEGRVVA